ncbi:MAG: hypothetical protein IT204_00475 [Fimbriimonadaceae bacterium]|nr:hypothetical protein [Fimbriimonadaceae bacterium]
MRLSSRSGGSRLVVSGSPRFGRLLGEAPGSLARLAVSTAARLGGSWPQAVFGASGECVAVAPLAAPAVRAVSDWRLSGRSLEWLRWAADDDRGAPPDGPQTAADGLVVHGLSSLCDRDEAPGLAATLQAASPWAGLVGEQPLAQAQVWLTARWLRPYFEPALARAWHSRLDHLQRHPDRATIAALAAHLRAYRQWAVAASEPAALAPLVGLLARWWRVAGGGSALRDGVAAGLPGSSLAEREALERAWAEILELAPALAATAVAARAQGWQRTAAEEAWLGRYARDLEPQQPDLAAWCAALQRWV